MCIFYVYEHTVNMYVESHGKMPAVAVAVAGKCVLFSDVVHPFNMHIQFHSANNYICT